MNQVEVKMSRSVEEKLDARDLLHLLGRFNHGG